MSEAVVGMTYRHYRGDLYVVEAVALESTNGRPRERVVVYRGSKGLNVRTEREFLESGRFVPVESGGQQQAAAPQAPPDPKVWQMSEDAKAFGPAAQPIDGRCAVMLRCMRPVCHDGGHEYTSPPEPVITREELRKLLDDAVPGAEELGRSLKRVFRLPDDDLRLDSASASGGARGAAPKEPTSANAEGAKALEIARAEGKAEGRREMAEEAAVWCEKDARNEDGPADYAGALRNAAKAIRSLIPAAPGGSVE